MFRVLASVLTTLLVSCATQICVDGSSQLIDDFSGAGRNSIRGFRSGLGVNVDLSYPQQAISIRENGDFLLVSLGTHKHILSLGGKSLRIEYTAFSSGERSILYTQFASNRVDTVSFQIHVSFHEGHNHVSIPFSQFHNADLTLAHEIGVGGPLLVHRLELVDTAVSSSSTGPRTSHPQTADPAAHPLSPGDVVPSQINRMEPNNPDNSLRNLNSLELKRGGVGITKIVDGIEIDEAGYLFEKLVSDSEIINLRKRMIRLTYSATHSFTLTIVLQYHQSINNPGAIASILHVDIPAGNRDLYDIPISHFPSVHPLDSNGIWVIGPVKLHRIELLFQHRTGVFGRNSAYQSEGILVDDLSTWPYAWSSLENAPNWTTALYGIPRTPGNRNPTGRNNLGHSCGGRGAFLYQQGIHLTHHGYLFEPITPYGVPFNMSGALIEIAYSSTDTIVRQVQVQEIIPNYNRGDVRYGIHSLNVQFPPGRNETVQFSVGDCGPSQAIRINVKGEIQIHSIRLHIPIPWGENQFYQVIVDDFALWAQSEISSDIENQPPSHPIHLHQNTIATRPNIVFDYSQPFSYHTHTLLGDCNLIRGQGVKITSDGSLAQTLPMSVGKTLTIKYSTAYLGTRKISIETCGDKDNFMGQCREVDMHVMFNRGQTRELGVPLSDISIGNKVLPIIGVRIFGPLLIHRMELKRNLEVFETFPGDSKPDALLIDDFSNWRQVNSNTLRHGRASLGNPGPGYLTLHGWRDFLVEHFAGLSETWDLNVMAFRLTYTAQNTVTCEMSLLKNMWNGTNAMGPLDATAVTNIEFIPGSNKELVLPVSNLFTGSPLNSTDTYYGVRIEGPLVVGYDVAYPLTFHRIELMSNPPFDAPIEPKQTVSGPQNSDSYEVKLAALKSELVALRSNEQLDIAVRRTEIWKDAFSRIMELGPLDLHRKLTVRFIGEVGRDLGGLTREFFSLLAMAINDPNYALFTTPADAGYALQINPGSHIQGEIHLQYFKFIGRVIGMAILSENVLGIRLAPTLYKKLVDGSDNPQIELPELKKVDIGDIDLSALKAHDPVLHASLEWYLQNDISRLPETTFTLEWPEFGNITHIDLVKNGSQHRVTETNKNQYVKEYAHWHLEKKVEIQAKALRDGVHELVPQPMLAPFHVHELELLIGGQAQINLTDWISHTTYQNEYSRTHRTIQVFWKCMRRWDNARRAAVLQFVTGSPRLPSTGFAGLEVPFTITQVAMTNPYPRAATCFNQLKLPPYERLSVMRERLAVAIGTDMSEFSVV